MLLLLFCLFVFKVASTSKFITNNLLATTVVVLIIQRSASMYVNPRFNIPSEKRSPVLSTRVFPRHRGRSWG